MNYDNIILLDNDIHHNDNNLHNNTGIIENCNQGNDINDSQNSSSEGSDLYWFAINRSWDKLRDKLLSLDETNNNNDNVVVESNCFEQRHHPYHLQETTRSCSTNITPLYRNNGGKTVLHVAIENSAPPDVIQSIIDTFSSSNVIASIDKFGQTPLHVAGWTTSKNPSICQILMDAYPDAALIPDCHGRNPLHLAMDAEEE
eukprot:4426111-Ditylum_brightwellii.AAC.1